MTALHWQLRLFAMLIGAGVSSTITWQWQANSFGRQLAEQAEAFERERQKSSAAVIALQSNQQAQRRALELRLQESDKAHYKEMRDAQSNHARLRDRLATADVRLSVVLDSARSIHCPVPADPGAGGVVHGTTRAELDRAHAQRIVGIVSEGDQGLIALAACQAFVRSVMATD
ncbi:lysis protein [Pseudomonas viridiflava]|uniref:lysis system i-spanin subunit Rz n=1 Tax=Pseudomonas viridiflava TaxID=33069 RepID=UPI00178513EB|nr:lysis system i-spanin subunit Rz [Pseudomonas viridiflava]MBD8187831.1 lysis protein [Pseudomonas viridiflava]